VAHADHGGRPGSRPPARSLALNHREDGRVGEVAIQKSAGYPDLDEAAANAVRRWRFDPARKGAEAVAMWVLLPVEFHLKDRGSKPAQDSPFPVVAGASRPYRTPRIATS